MEPDQRGGRPLQVAQDDRDRLLLLVPDAVGDDPPGPESRGQIRVGQPIDELLAQPAMANQLLDRNDLQLELLGQGVKLLSGGAAAVGVEDFELPPQALAPAAAAMSAASRIRIAAA